MFRILTRQAVKVIQQQFRLSTGASSYIHRKPLPYSCPLSYDTLVRPFSSDIDPHACSIHKRKREAEERDKFVDIHDIGGLGLENYDVLIPNIKDKVLRGEITEVLGIPYHAKATAEDTSREIETG